MAEAVETYPPIPQQLGSVTFRAAEVATAASAEEITEGLMSAFCHRYTRSYLHIPAFPPFLRISRPASVAKGCEDDTTPLVPYTTDRLLGNLCRTISGRSTLSQSIFILARPYR